MTIGGLGALLGPDGSPRLGIKRERSAGKATPNAAAAPATVSGESSVTRPLGFVPGRRRQAMTRESGDLPSAVVTREHVGRGVSAVDDPIVLLRMCGEASFAVTCHRRADRDVFLPSPERRRAAQPVWSSRGLCARDLVPARLGADAADRAIHGRRHIGGNRGRCAGPVEWSETADRQSHRITRQIAR